MRLVVFPEALVDVSVRVVVPAFPVRHIVVPLSLVPIAVLEDFFAVAFPLAALVQVSGVDGLAVLRQTLFLNVRQVFFFSHPIEPLLVLIIRLVAFVIHRPQVHL